MEDFPSLPEAPRPWQPVPPPVPAPAPVSPAPTAAPIATQSKGSTLHTKKTKKMDLLDIMKVQSEKQKGNAKEKMSTQKQGGTSQSIASISRAPTSSKIRK